MDGDLLSAVGGAIAVVAFSAYYLISKDVNFVYYAWGAVGFALAYALAYVRKRISGRRGP